MMKTKLTLFVAVLAAILFGVGCSSLDKGLVAYYPFNGNAKDESGNGNDGEVKGATPAEDRHGEKGSSYNFDGDDYIELGPMNFGDKLTISAWVQLKEETGKANTIFAKYDGHESGDPKPHRRSVQLVIGSSNAGWTTSKDGERYHDMTSTPESLILNNMHHIAVSYGLGNQSIYINGKLDNKHDLETGELFKSDVPVCIGAHISFQKYRTKEGYARVVQHYLTGSIDDVRIYNRALSDDEVKALYDLEKPNGK